MNYKNRFYIYYLRRPDRPDPLEPSKGQPFYVGKGSKNRKDIHREQALWHQKYNITIHNYKINTIISLWRDGIDFTSEIMFNNLTEKQAFQKEIEIIERYGRINNNTGILTNLTKGGEGETVKILKFNKYVPKMAYSTRENKNTLTPIKAIRLHCLDCCAGSYRQVKDCEEDCRFYPWRMGKNPKKKGIGGVPTHNKIKKISKLNPCSNQSA